MVETDLMSQYPIGYGENTLSSKQAHVPKIRAPRLDRAGIAILLAAAIAALTHLSSYAQPPEPDDDFPGSPGSGLIIRSEITRLLVPGRLLELARQDTGHSSIERAIDLQRRLKAQGLEDLWYVVTRNTLMANGGTMDLSFIRYPAREPVHFREFQEDLALLAPDAARAPSDEERPVSIERIPDEIAKGDPHAAVDRLLHRGKQKGDRAL
jgi:hypothetical protein